LPQEKKKITTARKFNFIPLVFMPDHRTDTNVAGASTFFCLCKKKVEQTFYPPLTGGVTPPGVTGRPKFYRKRRGEADSSNWKKILRVRKKR
jgi:hypothetical protein